MPRSSPNGCPSGPRSRRPCAKTPPAAKSRWSKSRSSSSKGHPTLVPSASGRRFLSCGLNVFVARNAGGKQHQDRLQRFKHGLIRNECENAAGVVRRAYARENEIFLRV